LFLLTHLQAELNGRRRQIGDAAQDINDQLKDLKHRGQTKVNEKSANQDRLAGLDTQSGQQEHKLQQLSRDSYQAWKWIQAHQDQFEHKIYGPPLIECSLKDPKYANAIESLFQENDFKAFTAQSRNDFYTLQRILNREMKLQDVSLRVCSNSSMDQYQAPLSNVDLRSCGMQGWAIDFLNGPDVVLAMLCGEKFLHATAISLGDISQEQFNHLENSNVRSWVVNGTLFQAVRRREYGAAGNSTRTRALREARIWTNRPIDPAAKELLQQRIRETESDIAVIKEEMTNLAEQRRELAAENKANLEETESLKADKEAKQRALTIFKALPTKLDQEEQKLAAISEYLEGVRGRLENIQKDWDKVLLEKVQIAIKYSEVVAEFRKTHDGLLELEMQHLEAKSDFETLKARNEHVQATLKAKQDEEKAAAEEAIREAAKAKEFIIHVKRLAAEAEDLAEAGDPALTDYLAAFGRKSADELEADIESEKAKLELTHEGNSNIIKEFEDRQKRIDMLHKDLQKFTEQSEEVQSAIKEIREQWEPELDALIAKISDAFSDSFARIGCAGQVTVFKASSSDKDDAGNVDGGNLSDQPAGSDGLDFANWAIHISVKFRDSEPLSLLDSHRQSGGERAVSTIFYLMALQSLSRAPFRVVDEINQGMDPRNERMVHGRMVDIACGEDSRDGEKGPGSQYFLITPKLLSGLKYKRGMRVLNIVSGERMPAYGVGEHRVDFEAWVMKARELGLNKMMGRSGGVGGDMGGTFGGSSNGGLEEDEEEEEEEEDDDGDDEDGVEDERQLGGVNSQRRIAVVAA
jgi:structural maintenance of chromosomes protein 5